MYSGNFGEFMNFHFYDGFVLIYNKILLFMIYDQFPDTPYLIIGRF